MTAGAEVLVCLAYAGGAASDVYAGWPSALPGVDVVPVDYPGRGRRWREVPASSWPDLVADVADQVRERVANRSWAIFGHSMGAAVALDVARAATAGAAPDGGPCGTASSAGPAAPRTVLVSGRRPPGDPPAQPVDAAADDDRLLDLVGPWGGIPATFLERPNLLPLVLRPLRADLALSADPAASTSSPGALRCDLHVLFGRDDPLTPRDRLGRWARETTATTRFHEFPGGHFFLGERALAPLVVVRSALDGSRHGVSAP